MVTPRNKRTRGTIRPCKRIDRIDEIFREVSALSVHIDQKHEETRNTIEQRAASLHQVITQQLDSAALDRLGASEAQTPEQTALLVKSVVELRRVQDATLELVRRIEARPWARMNFVAAPRPLALTFAALRAANVQRLKAFAHAVDWTPAQWLQALVGELGEYANLRKKRERGDLGATEFFVAARRELADVQCYLDLLAWSLDVDLAKATIEKFNEVSAKRGSDVRL